MTRATVWVTRWAVAGVFVAFLFVGCDSGPKIPPTYPVKGKVVMAGGKPWNIEGANISFTKADDDKVTAVGGVEKDGSFKLTTLMYGKQRDGAAEGEHIVWVELGAPPGEALAQRVERLTGVKKYKVEAKPNDLTVEVKKQ